jgi:hypothetical protein
MTNEIRDPQFAHYVDEQAEALSHSEPSFRLGVIAPLATLIGVHGAKQRSPCFRASWLVCWSEGFFNPEVSARTW